MVRWPAKVQPGVSEAAVSQIDFFGVMSKITGNPVPDDAAPDTFDSSDTWLGLSDQGREYVVIQSASSQVSLIRDQWKLIPPSRHSRYNPQVNIELGHDTIPQLYDLRNDPEERQNLAGDHPERVEALTGELMKLKNTEVTRPQVVKNNE
jgi:arylsulfatase A-like enzyme